MRGHLELFGHVGRGEMFLYHLHTRFIGTRGQAGRGREEQEEGWSREEGGAGKGWIREEGEGRWSREEGTVGWSMEEGGVGKGWGERRPMARNRECME